MNSLVIAASALACPLAAVAQDGADADRLARLEAALAAQDARIAQLEAQLAAATAPAEAPAPPAPAPAAPAQQAPPQVSLNGDLRLRYEHNWIDNTRDRGRFVIRGRLEARYQPLPGLTLGVRAVTGDPDDPNSADLTLTGYNDDLQISLDRIYARYEIAGAQLWLGQIPQPFRKTDMLWDDDVNPEGIAITWQSDAQSAVQVRLAGLYDIIDEAPAGEDSSLIAGQAQARLRASDQLEAGLAVAWLDYQLGSVAGADNGDFRGNLRDANGGYLSDFNLADVLVWLTIGESGSPWQLQLTGNWVHNTRAALGQSDGIFMQGQLGRLRHPGDVRGALAYFDVDTDAVFAAFSHDNFDLATNYRAATASLDIQLARAIQLQLNFARYQSKDAALQTVANTPWLNRLRTNLVASF